MKIMQSDPFDREKAKRFLADKEQKERDVLEEERKKVLQKTVIALKEEFQNTSVEIYLVGSILRPYNFSPRSDIDIVVKGFQGDRFDLWTKLENKLARKIEIIPFETCLFQEFVLKEGLKVV
jgi:predicted nucleotidyltransferase